MDPITRPQPINLPARKTRSVVGIALITIGLVVLLDRYLKTGWLALLILPGLGFLLLVGGIRYRRMNWVVPGGILSGIGLGGFFALSVILGSSMQYRIGILLLFFAIGWGIITLTSTQVSIRVAWWALIPASVTGSVGATLLFSPTRPVDFGLYLFTSLGLAFLGWGIADHLLGLIIPGCLLSTLGPGLYLAWGSTQEVNGLAQVGILVVSLGLGWGLITLFSRLHNERFLWWPLIPGGVCAMVGWGLYIGGNPDNAVSFIGNTGSIGLIIFGIYLLLWRKGIQH